MKWRYSIVAFVLLFVSLSSGQTYVATNGTPSGNGTSASPWDLQTALNQDLPVGDTIFIRGGVYSGNYIARVHGVVVKSYANERVTIEGNASASEDISFLLMSSCSNLTFQGIEFGSSTRGGSNGIVTQQVNVNFDNVRFINCVIHDYQNNVALWREATNAELYGCIIYNAGYDASDRGHGHSIYAMNQTGRKRIENCIIFGGYANGVQAYGSATQYADNFTIKGNIIANAGNASSIGGGWNLIAGREGSTSITVGDSVCENMTYRSQNNGNFGGVAFGWDGGQLNGVLNENYLVSGMSGDVALQLVQCTNLTMAGNTIIGSIQGFSPSTYPNNIYFSSRPTSGMTQFLRVNKYNPSRVNLAVYNWSGNSSVVLSLSGFASLGDTVRIYNAQNYYGDAPAIAVVDNSGNISVSMAGWTIATPIGGTNSQSTFPVFGAFVLAISKGSNSMVSTPVNVPEGFDLYPNHPNPFNTQTVIRFRVPKLTQIRLVVSDDLGRQISVLADDWFSAGAYDFRFDGTNLASGVYYCQLVMEGTRLTQKMVLLK